MSPVPRRPALGLAVLATLTLGCEPSRVESVQIGYRGTGTELNFNPRRVAESVAANRAPAALPPAPPQDPAPEGTWQNVQVLNGLSVNEFNRTMIAMTNWVSPKQGCLYCHNANNFASDSLYTKVVSRRMIQMNQHINQNYQPHVAATGVTCYTCHMGNNVPANLWFFTGVNQPLRHYLDREDVRVQSNVALKGEDTNHTSIKQAEYTYSLMLNISQGLGVNCTYCHNSRQWGSWQAAGGYNRLLALRGIRMVRDLNSNYLVPLQDQWPANRLGPHGDGPKLQCSTCHNGAYKPLYGAKMAADYPALLPPPESADSYSAPAPTSRTPEDVSLLTRP